LTTDAHVRERRALAGDPVWVGVQSHEHVLHHVLGCRPVTDEESGEPDELEVMRTKDLGDA